MERSPPLPRCFFSRTLVVGRGDSEGVVAECLAEELELLLDFATFQRRVAPQNIADTFVDQLADVGLGPRVRDACTELLLQCPDGTWQMLDWLPVLGDLLGTSRFEASA